MSSSIQKHAFNLPNLLTYSRILVIPVIVLFMALQGPENSLETNRLYSYIATILFVIAGISDLVDGYFARKWGQVSVLGKLMDTLADKLVHMAVMVMMIEMLILPAWLVIVLLFREMTITGLRGLAATQGIVIAAGSLGKNKAALLNVALTALLLNYGLWGLNSYSIGWICLTMATVVSFVSGFQYIYLFIKQISKDNGSKN